MPEAKTELGTQRRKILIMGLPGSGKTTLARLLAARLSAVHLNADEIRANVHKDLGFSHEDRIEHARRMGWLCDQIERTGIYVIADFVCPTPETRAAFGPAFTIWVDRVQSGRFEDTNQLFVPPQTYDVRVSAAGAPEAWADRISARLRPTFNPRAPTALFGGRYQPFHDGHRALIEEGIRRVGQACVAVRETHGIDDDNPYPFEAVRARIEAALAAWAGRFIVVQLPNVTHIFYGRNVGYANERIDLSPELQSVSATAVRAAIRSLPQG